MPRFPLVLAVLAALVLPASAQMSGPAGGASMPPPNPNGPGSNQIPSNLPQTRGTATGINRPPKANPEADKARAQQAVQAFAIACQMTDSRVLASGKQSVNGQDVPTQVYEVACSDGLGYILQMHDSQPGMASSCFAAEGAHQDAVAKHEEYPFYCQLPANADIRRMAQNQLAKSGTGCTAARSIWFGVSRTDHLEYTEVACSDGKGYLLATAMPGYQTPTRVMSCIEAAQRGLQCKLTSTPAVARRPTQEDLVAALSQHGVACTVQNFHFFGQETKQKRYVAEFSCPEHPEGVVAFIPLNGNATPFETRSCAQAAKVGVQCTLSK
ncbi:MAG: hypothetical protein KGJ78_06395 [Alphaproteobacteria bacterium]|nr:hypothetical protein [Alphaproteobacteria bacterium]